MGTQLLKRSEKHFNTNLKFQFTYNLHIMENMFYTTGIKKKKKKIWFQEQPLIEYVSFFLRFGQHEKNSIH